MNAADFEAVTFDGAVYCNACLPEPLGTESEGVAPIFADSEWDAYPVCDVCRYEHDYVSLTDEGRRQRQRRGWSERVREMARRDGKLPAFSWPGGYPIVYLAANDGAICPKCANDPDEAFSLTTAGVHWEGAPIECENCGDDIESAYGDPDADKTPAPADWEHTS